MRLLAAFLSLVSALEAFGQLSFQSSSTIRSRSGQFVVAKAPTLFGTMPLGSGVTNAGMRVLNPELLAVSAERIKQALLRELGVNDRWSGKIYLGIMPAVAPDGPIQFTSEYYLSGWVYRLGMPESVEEMKLVRALVQTLLLEFANRNASSRSAEIPLWLAEGLTQKITARATDGLILQPSESLGLNPEGQPVGPGRWIVSAQRGTTKVARRTDPMTAVRAVLSERAPLTFAELSFPSPEQLTPENVGIYQASSHLLLNELAVLPEGRPSLAALLQQTSQFWNWQTAFLKAFHKHFASLLETEKWWAVTLARFTGRDEWQALPRAVALQKLEDVLRIHVQVRASTNQVPSRTVMTLEEVIRDMEFSRQKEILPRTVGQLAMLRLRMPPDVVPLVDAYREFLQSYLHQRNQAGYAPVRKGQPVASIRLLIREALKRLESLERQRQGLAPEEPNASLSSR
jgi:hypothetical protein